MRADEFLDEVEKTYNTKLEADTRRHIAYCLRLADLEQITDKSKGAALDIVELELSKLDEDPNQRTAAFGFGFRRQAPREAAASCPLNSKHKMVGIKLANDADAFYCEKCRVTIPNSKS